MTGFEQGSLLPPPPPAPGGAAAVPPPPPPPPPKKSLAERGHKSVAGLGRSLQILMVVWTVVAGLAAGATIRFRNALADLETNPLALTPDDVVRLENVTDVYGIIQIVLFCSTALVFVIWFRRMHVNLRAFGEPRTEHSDGWAVGGWLVPFLNFVRPKQIADDIWSRSDPERSRGGATPGSLRGTVPKLIHWWWGIYLASGFSAWFAGLGGSVDSVSGATARATWWFIGDLLQIVLGVVTFLVVAAFTERQGRRAAYITAQEDAATPVSSTAQAPSAPVAADLIVDAPVAPPVQDEPVGPEDVQIPPEAPRKARYAWAAGALAVSVVAIAVSAALIEEPADPQAVSGTPTVVFDLEPGDCFNFPESIDRTDFSNVQAILAVDVLSCDEPHSGEMVTDVRSSVIGSAFPGDEALVLEATELCFPEVERYVGANFLLAGVDVFVVVPDRFRWASGDRDLSCMATALDTDHSLGWSLRNAGTALPDDRRTWWSLQLGDCFDEPVGSTGLSMEVVSCVEPHDYETFAVLTHPAAVGAAYPGEVGMFDWAEDECATAYVDVIDREKSANLDFGFGGSPIEETWVDGHRTVTCVLWNQVGKLTESVLLD